MKTNTTVETTITIQLSPQDMAKFVADHKLVPADWTFYSIDILGLGLSKGAIMTLKCTQHGHSIPTTK